jgi:hypothetical protein
MPTPTGRGREGAIAPRSSHNPTLPGFSRNEFRCQPTAGAKRSGDSMRRFGLLSLRRRTSMPSIASAQRTAGEPLHDPDEARCSRPRLNPRQNSLREGGRSLPLSQIRMN